MVCRVVQLVFVAAVLFAGHATAFARQQVEVTDRAPNPIALTLANASFDGVEVSPDDLFDTMALAAPTALSLFFDPTDEIFSAAGTRVEWLVIDVNTLALSSAEDVRQLLGDRVLAYASGQSVSFGRLMMARGSVVGEGFVHDGE